MNKSITTVLLALVFVLAWAGDSFAIPNDVNGDGEVDVVDVQCVVLTVLGPGLPDCLANPEAADLNCSGATDVVDYQLMVLVVLAYPQPGVPAIQDADGNNIVDACEGQQTECGNGECEAGENCVNCEVDCDACGDWKPGDIIITEIMKDPKLVTDTMGEWFEIRNMTAQAIDLAGWTIKDNGGETHVINNGGPLPLGASSILVMGNNGNTNTNCGVNVAYVFTGFTLDNGDDEVILVAPDGTVIDEVWYNDNEFPDVAGRTLSLNPTSMNSVLNDDGSNWCVGTMMMQCQDWGTPGFMNLNCPAPAICGNGVVEQPTEQCDPPQAGVCDADCQFVATSICGNGVQEPGEGCDDGNLNNGDGCNDQCQKEGAQCGNNIVEPGEECDDGNFIDEDGCDMFCKLEAICGNSITEVGEQCDPPNPPFCSELCQFGYEDALCGDGVKHEDEMCDDGCMQGIPHVCEIGVDDGDNCNYECELEEDPWICGNGIEDPDEMCDDGNTENGDGCDDECKIEIIQPSCSPSPCCGDLMIDPGENCDDGNNDPGDGCDAECAVEFQPVCSPSPCCGDGNVDEGEECDDGNADGSDGCSAVCEAEASCSPSPCCGDHNVDPGEQCDDGNVELEDGCDADCQYEGGGKVGTVTGTISFSGNSTEADSLRIFMSPTPPPDFSSDMAPPTFMNPDFPKQYTYPNVIPGDYYVVAYFDADNDAKGPDDLGAGDMLGAYPTYAGAQLITVGEEETVAGIDFSLTTKP